MSTVERLLTPLLRVARALLPDALVDAVRDFLIRRLHLRSMVSREFAPVVWFRRVILRRKPVLYHFETHITDHCNLNCKGCSHFSTLCSPAYADLAEFSADMHRMAGLFSAVRQIILLGGEPLLHPDVVAFIRTAREAFPATRIYLLTNALLVTRMGEEFWVALAETGVVLRCGLYPVGLPKDEIDRLGRTHGVGIEWTAPHARFFKTPIDVDGMQDVASSFAGCERVMNCPILRDGRLFPCAYSAYSHVLAARFELAGLEANAEDSISIRDGALGDDIMKFLGNPVSWCSHCDMDSRTSFAWTRTKRTPEEWLQDR